MVWGVSGTIRSSRLLALVVSLTFVSGCANGPDGLRKSEAARQAEIDEALENDPWAPFNHAMYQFNYHLDRWVLKPITQGYEYIIPRPGRVVISNVLDNLYTPVVFANSVLQGDPQNSFATLWRFILNTTYGLGGTIDFASSAGLKNRPADFGETLAMYGVGAGPYLVLPVIGPSSPRDAFGRVGDAFMDPFTYMDYSISVPRDAMMVVDTRSRSGKVIDDIYENSIDPYETLRGAYIQKRAEDIHKAETARQKALDQATGK